MNTEAILFFQKNLQSKDEMYTSLYNQIHQILNIVPKPNESMGCTNTTEYTPVDFRSVSIDMVHYTRM